MLKIPLVLPLLVSISTGLAGAAEPPAPAFRHEACSKARLASCGPADGSGRAGDVRPADLSQDPWTDATDVLHYDLDLEVRTTDQHLDGTNRITVKSLDGEATAFRVRLDERLRVSAITVDGASADSERIDDVTLEITTGIHPVGAVFEIVITYAGTPARTPDFGGIFFDQIGSKPLVFTLSEPWDSYAWWPPKDDNHDKATADLRFTVPSTFEVASNGVLVSTEALDSGRKRFHWHTDYPIAPYLVSFAATAYHRFESTFLRGERSMPVSFFVFPGDDNAENRAGWLRSVDMLGAFSDLYGLYPFFEEKYGIYEFTFGGGMEHQTMTGQGGFDESLTSHELSHQWWGDMVTCATWHDIWLNEGFATYSEVLWEEWSAGSRGHERLVETMQGYRPQNPTGSVYVYDVSNVDRVFDGDLTYAKGAWVLHMLRNVVGDDAFFGTLSAYRDAFAYGAATTDDFRAVAEAVSGRDLGWFFDEWVYGALVPSYRWAFRPIVADGRNFMEIYVGQAGSSSQPPIRMPIDFRISGNGFPESTVRLADDFRSQHFLVETPGPADMVTFDPESAILWSNVTVVNFPQSGPRIVASDPPPGGTRRPGSTRPITLTFHRPVTAPAWAFVLRNGSGGAVPVAIFWNPDFTSVTLTPTVTLPEGSYVLDVSDAVVDAASGKALDGEITGPLPSGNGVPGGKSQLAFEVSNRRRVDAAGPGRD